MIGTLGDPLYPSTCSYAAAVHYYPKEKIILFPTFEECIHALKQHRIQSVLIPAAYPNINPIIMDEELRVTETFLYRIPNLVLAQKGTHHQSEILYLHPATRSLCSKIHPSYQQSVFVSSNTEAALKAIHTPESLCITNQLCAEQWQLNIKQVMRQDLAIPFIHFQRAAS